MRQYIIVLIIALLLIAAAGCTIMRPAVERGYKHISQDEAKALMAEDNGSVIVDVRRKDEYNEGHISGAVCIPNETIGSTAPKELPDKDAILLIYCRSGRRSRQAAEKLAALNYTNVFEFGGITDWTEDIE